MYVLIKAVYLEIVPKQLKQSARCICRYSYYESQITAIKLFVGYPSVKVQSSKKYIKNVVVICYIELKYVMTINYQIFLFSF